MLFQFIPTKVHGILDYLTAAMLPVLPRVMGDDDRVTRLHDAVAVMTLGTSLMTDYELGAARVLPMKGHLAMDAMTGVGLMVAGAAMSDEDHTERACVAGLGMYYLVTALCTQTEPGDKRRRKMNRWAREGQSMKRYAEQVRPEAAGESGQGPMKVPNVHV